MNTGTFCNIINVYYYSKCSACSYISSSLSYGRSLKIHCKHVAQHMISGIGAGLSGKLIKYMNCNYSKLHHIRIESNEMSGEFVRLFVVRLS